MKLSNDLWKYVNFELLKNLLDLVLWAIPEGLLKWLQFTTTCDNLAIQKAPSKGDWNIWVFPKIGGKHPRSSILIGFSLINHPFWGTLIFGNTHIYSNNWNKSEKQLQDNTYELMMLWLLWHLRKQCWTLAWKIEIVFSVLKKEIYLLIPWPSGFSPSARRSPYVPCTWIWATSGDKAWLGKASHIRSGSFFEVSW